MTEQEELLKLRTFLAEKEQLIADQNPLCVVAFLLRSQFLLTLYDDHVFQSVHQ